MGILIFRLVYRGAGGVFGLGWIGTGGCYKRLVMAGGVRGDGISCCSNKMVKYYKLT